MTVTLFSFVSRLFLDMRPEHPDKRKMLPLKHQQAAFENIYLKAQEGMKLPVSSYAVLAHHEKFIISSFFSPCLTFSSRSIIHRDAALQRTRRMRRSTARPPCWRVCLGCCAVVRCVKNSVCLPCSSPTRRTTSRSSSSKRSQFQSIVHHS